MPRLRTSESDPSPDRSRPGPSDDRWLTLQEACDYLAVCGRTIRRMVTDGTLPDRRVGRQLRFKRADLDKALVQDASTAATVADLDDFINQSIG